MASMFQFAEQTFSFFFGLQDWRCTLSLKQHFEKTDNIIIQAKLQQYERLYNHSAKQEALDREKVDDDPGNGKKDSHLANKEFSYCELLKYWNHTR